MNWIIWLYKQSPKNLLVIVFSAPLGPNLTLGWQTHTPPQDPKTLCCLGVSS